VCIAARPPNLGREKDLLHFFCIGLFVFNFEISRANPRRGTHSRSAQRLNTPLAAVHTLRGILWEVPTSGKISKAEHESKADAPSAFATSGRVHKTGASSRAPCLRRRIDRGRAV